MNNSKNSRFSLLSFTIERKEYLPFKWYGGAVLAIPKNSLLLCPSSAFKLEEQLSIKQTNQLGILIDLFEKWGKWVCATAISHAEDLFNKRDVTVRRRIKKKELSSWCKWFWCWTEHSGINVLFCERNCRWNLSWDCLLFFTLAWIRVSLWFCFCWIYWIYSTVQMVLQESLRMTSRNQALKSDEDHNPAALPLGKRPGLH